ncbi:hypothetical protein LTR04_000073 [Oleoguttula sp. CCFEE 6159]|nr:hypothetical protein LTR04_000073 [Oleoguttula sp. CCFEE 6159]
MLYGAQRGFASMTTNTGHNGTNGDSTWALHQPEKKIDWAYRAMHGSVVIAKQVVSAFYSKKSFTSFYAGCSTGGYQGLKEVQMFPEDFDGVLVSAPAWWHSHLQTWSIKVGLYNLPVNSSHHIPASLFPTIGAEVLRQCDPSDGLVDGIISDPRRCDVNLEALLCTPSANKSACLTSPQISTLYKIYTDWYEADQTFVYNHLELGSESQWSLINTTSGTPDSFSIGYVQNWDFNYSIVQTAERLNLAMHDASNYNISAFRARGGKLLHYHGYADGFIPTGCSVYYYKHVQRALAPMGIELDDWYRLFLIPGMNHCSKSAVNAPWYIAGPNQAGGLVRGTGIRSVPGFEDAEHDMLMALVRWVEQKQAPDQIIGTKYKNDTVSEGVLRQRPICNYPNRAVYNGSGDVDDARSWKCVKGLQ